jgi:hypothetical protein
MNRYTRSRWQTYGFWTQVSQIRQRFIETARIFDLDAQIVLMARPPLRKVGSMLEVPSLTAHANCCIKVER